MLRYQKLRQSLNEQAMHFEIILNKLSPDILKERLALIRDKDKEELLADDQSIFHNILKAKGLLQFLKEEAPPADELMQSTKKRLTKKIKENISPNRAQNDLS